MSIVYDINTGKTPILGVIMHCAHLSLDIETLKKLQDTQPFSPQAAIFIARQSGSVDNLRSIIKDIEYAKNDDRFNEVKGFIDVVSIVYSICREFENIYLESGFNKHESEYRLALIKVLVYSCFDPLPSSYIEKKEVELNLENMMMKINKYFKDKDFKIDDAIEFMNDLAILAKRNGIPRSFCYTLNAQSDQALTSYSKDLSPNELCKVAHYLSVFNDGATFGVKDNLVSFEKFYMIYSLFRLHKPSISFNEVWTKYFVTDNRMIIGSNDYSFNNTIALIDRYKVGVGEIMQAIDSGVKVSYLYAYHDDARN